MNVQHLLTTPCTITTVTNNGDPDEYGDATESTTSTRTTCWVTRRGNLSDGGESVGVTDWQVDTLDLYLPPGTAITGADRVTVNGTTYEVVGPPHEHFNPLSQTYDFVSAVIRRVT